MNFEIDKYFKSKRYKNTKERIKNAFYFKDCDFDEVPLVIQTANMSVTDQDYEVFPKDYFINPDSMLRFQELSFEKHLNSIDDDYIPYLCPWYGIYVIPGHFGAKIVFPKNCDPAALPIINSMEEAKNLKKKNFNETDLTRRVIDTINYFKENSNYPVSVTDSQSPLNCINQIIGYQNLFYWMKDDPGLVHLLLDLISDILKDWTISRRK